MEGLRSPADAVAAHADGCGRTGFRRSSTGAIPRAKRPAAHRSAVRRNPARPPVAPVVKGKRRGWPQKPCRPKGYKGF